MKPRFRIGRLSLLCLLATSAEAADFIEIKADLRMATARAGNTNANAKPHAYQLLCATDGMTWRMDNDGEQASVKWLFDGTNVYQSMRILRPPSQDVQERLKSIQHGPAVSWDTSSMTIRIWPSSSGHPMGDWTVNLCWLAFCSADYLKQPSRPIPLPVDELRNTPDRFAYADKMTMLEGAPGLPQTIDLFLSKKLYLPSIEDFYRGWGTHYLPSMRDNVTNLHEGALMFHFEVTARTNFHGQTYPLRFAFSQKPRDFIQNGDWEANGIGTVVSMRQVERPKQIFDNSIQQTVVDYRFKDEETRLDANTYPWTNNSVPAIDDPSVQERFRERVDRARNHKRTP